MPILGQKDQNSTEKLYFIQMCQFSCVLLTPEASNVILRLHLTSAKQCCESRTGSGCFLGLMVPDPLVRGSVSFNTQAKIVKKTLIPTYCVVTSLWLLSLKKDLNVPSKVLGRKPFKPLFVGVLKFNDENSRIRIRTHMSRIRNTAAKPQAWSRTLLNPIIIFSSWSRSTSGAMYEHVVQYKYKNSVLVNEVRMLIALFPLASFP